MHESLKVKAELAKLPKIVRHSEPIQFAIRVIKTAGKKVVDAAAFFKLVDEAPFLMVCVMQMYFNHVHVLGFTAINRTNGDASQRDCIRLYTLSRWFGFDDVDETTLFCSAMGFDVDTSDGGGDSGVVERSATGGADGYVYFPSQDVNPAKVIKWKREQTRLRSKAASIKPSVIIIGGSGTTWGPFN